MDRDEFVGDKVGSNVDDNIDLSDVEISEIVVSEIEEDAIDEVTVNKNNKVGMQNVYPILLAVSLTVCAYSGYKYIMNLRDKGITDKKNEMVLEIGQPEVVEDKHPYLDVDLAPLREKNPDVVGWLKVGAVGVDVPLVQTTDNKFYLDNDIDKKKNSGGWVFADCKANLDHMATNTVIYGHNLRGRHFGLLKKFLDSDVSSKDGANIIQLTTKDKQMVFEVVSVYITNYDDWDYVKTSFSSDVEKTNFVNRLKDRNTVEAFQQDTLSASDNYLTFSTCHGAIGSDKRLVVHSRLVASRPTPIKDVVNK